MTEIKRYQDPRILVLNYLTLNKISIVSYYKGKKNSDLPIAKINKSKHSLRLPQLFIILFEVSSLQCTKLINPTVTRAILIPFKLKTLN